MKLNIAYPTAGSQKLIEVSDEHRIRRLHDKRISEEFDGALLGDEFRGYVFQITGGTDKQGFPMSSRAVTSSRVRLLLKEGQVGFRARRDGERRRKSVRGCIVGPEIGTLNLIIVTKGEIEIPGLTDVVHPRALGPKRVSRIVKMFDLSREDDVKSYVIEREIKPRKEGDQVRKIVPKVQRLRTERKLARKISRKQKQNEKSEQNRLAAEQYASLLKRLRSGV